MTAPEPPAVPDREARRARLNEEWARLDAEAEQRTRHDARIDDAAAAAPSVLPGKVGEALAAMLEAMKPFRAADGHMALSHVGRSSDEVAALAEAILALPADAVRLPDEPDVRGPVPGPVAVSPFHVWFVPGADPSAETGQAREPDEVVELARRARFVRAWWSDWPASRRAAVRVLSSHLADALDDLRDPSQPLIGIVPPTLADEKEIRSG